MKKELQNIITLCKETYSSSYMSYVTHRVKSNKELYNWVLKFKETLELDTEFLSEVYFIILGGERKICKECNKYTKFIDFEKGYSDFCCNKCSHNSEEYREKMSKILKGKENKNKGKTYKEIYGSSKPKCGFQEGHENVAKREEVKSKISIGVAQSYTEELREKRRQQVYKTQFYKSSYSKKYENKIGEKFRSNLEVKFSELLINNSIKYEYEKVVMLNNNKRKVVDFVIDGNLFIEITGYAYSGWREDFIKKIKWLRESVKKEDFLLILTYKKNIEDLFFDNIMVGENVFFGEIENEERILKSIKFIQQIISTNKLLKYEDNFKE